MQNVFRKYVSTPRVPSILVCVRYEKRFFITHSPSLRHRFIVQKPSLSLITISNIFVVKFYLSFSGADLLSSHSAHTQFTPLLITVDFAHGVTRKKFRQSNSGNVRHSQSLTVKATELHSNALLAAQFGPSLRRSLSVFDYNRWKWVVECETESERLRVRTGSFRLNIERYF